MPPDIKWLFGFAFLFAVAIVGANCVGCSQASRALAGADVAAYKLELDACIAQGKDAGSLAVYETCARAADARHGLDGGAR